MVRLQFYGKFTVPELLTTLKLPEQDKYQQSLMPVLKIVKLIVKKKQLADIIVRQT